jgi:hypothetical protein
MDNIVVIDAQDRKDNIIKTSSDKCHPTSKWALIAAIGINIL